MHVVRTLSSGDKRLADLPHRFRQPGEHELGIEPKHLIPQAPEPPIAPSISAPPERVVATIHLNYEPCTGGEEIHNVLPEHSLPAKRNAEPFSAERCPEHALRSSGGNAHLLSAGREKPRALSEAWIPRVHGDLLAAQLSPVQATPERVDLDASKRPPPIPPLQPPIRAERSEAE